MESVWQTIMDSIAVPALTAIGAFVLVILKNFTDRISRSIVAKNKADQIEKQFAAKSLIIEQIQSIVKSTVAANMQWANELKKQSPNHQLTEEQVVYIQEYVREEILNTLPSGLTDPTDDLCKMIGGRGRLDSMISSMIERYVYEYKEGMGGC